MGTWGPGLYANDLAKDLKATISSVMRLPLDSHELVTLLEKTFPGPSGQNDDEEHTTFWLVLADQFHKRGLSDSRLFDRAREIIDSGADLNSPERLEMSAEDRRSREKMLRDLRDQLSTAPTTKPRRTIAKPQQLLMGAGDVYVFPVFAHNNCINPYASKWSHQQEQWGAVCIVRSGHAFGYLAYYNPLVLACPFDIDRKPSLMMLLESVKWELRRPGTCSKLHFSRLKLELAGTVSIDQRKLSQNFPEMRDGRYQAVNDISIADSLIGVMGCDGSVGCLRDIIAD